MLLFELKKNNQVPDFKYGINLWIALYYIHQNIGTMLDDVLSDTKT
jgi:hypothetical protein